MAKKGNPQAVILGVCNANVSGATLLVGGKVLASVNEERFSRVKNHRAFPTESIAYCLRHAGITARDVDEVACGAWGGMEEGFISQCTDEIAEAVRRDPTARSIIRTRTRVAVERDHQFKAELIAGLCDLGLSADQVHCTDHHVSHAYTAFYPSPFEKALVLTIDGRGDFKSATVSRASRSSGLRLLHSVSMYSSLGVFYGFITRFLGFIPDRHEGKVTGLAAHGDPSKCLDILQKMIGYKNGTIVANVGQWYSPFITGEVPQVEKALRNHSREDVAAAAQHLLEETVTAYLAPFLETTGLRHVCLAGGVFGNVALNQTINEMDGVDGIYVFPQMGDGGNAFGGALIRLYEMGGTFEYPLRSVYLGPEYAPREVRQAVSRDRTSPVCEDLEQYTVQRIARDLSEGAIVGLLTGRMEYGPRALGARSILAQATEHRINETLNARLHRTEFMPFAPVTLEEHAADCYKGWHKDDLSSRFMTLCYDCTDAAKQQTPGTVHVNGTARPQVISRDDNPLYYDILAEYYRLTGIPTLVNTSFNNHEEPIVCSPEDAIQSLLMDNVDYVVMGDLVVRRRSGESGSARVSMS